MELNMTVFELNAQISQLRGELKSFYDKLPKGTDQETGLQGPKCTPDDILEFKRRNEELTQLTDQRDVLVKSESFINSQDPELKRVVNVQGQEDRPTLLSDAILGNPRFRDAKDRTERSNIGDFTIDRDFIRDVKATVTTSSGFPPLVLRTGDVVAAVSRPPQFIDFMNVFQTDQNSLAYMTQTTRTNAAVETAEGSALAESSLVWTAATDVIRKIGTFVPVTEEQLEDEPQVANLINNDLLMMVRQRLDLQVIAGSGSGQNLTGIVNRSGIQTQALSTETLIDGIGSAMAKVQLNAYSAPNVCLMHVTDMWKLAKAKDVTSGQYLLADPGATPNLRAWGLNVIRSEATSAGTAIIVDTSYFKLAMRRGVEVGVGYQNDDFVKNLVTVRAYCRAGLLSLRDSAACKLTGI
mgnify:CR=1 FL=1